MLQAQLLALHNDFEGSASDCFLMRSGTCLAKQTVKLSVPRNYIESLLSDARILIATSVMSGRADSAPAKVIALFRERVSANNQRLNITT